MSFAARLVVQRRISSSVAVKVSFLLLIVSNESSSCSRSSRFPDLYLAQGERHSRGNFGSSYQGLCEFNILESHKPGHVRLGGRRQSRTHVSKGLRSFTSDTMLRFLTIFYSWSNDPERHRSIAGTGQRRGVSSTGFPRTSALRTTSAF